MNNKLIKSQQKDLGGFCVRRILPSAAAHMVGPFIFFDHIGPAHLSTGKGLDVRPHPHIGLATVTYLFAGQIFHRDNLGSQQLIKPGDINWMTAGSGIVHSERTPLDLRKNGSEISGIQCWVALPDEYEDTAPNFAHYSSACLPEFKIDDVSIKLLVGSAFGYHSPVATHSELFYLDVDMPQGSSLKFEVENQECAAYIINGKASLNNEELIEHEMLVNTNGILTIYAEYPTHIILLGGKPVGKRYIWWNFVSSSKQKIEEAATEWMQGPGPRLESQRFTPIPNDDQEFIPLSKEQFLKNPKGNIM